MQRTGVSGFGGTPAEQGVSTAVASAVGGGAAATAGATGSGGGAAATATTGSGGDVGKALQLFHWREVETGEKRVGVGEGGGEVSVRDRRKGERLRGERGELQRWDPGGGEEGEGGKAERWGDDGGEGDEGGAGGKAERFSFDGDGVANPQLVNQVAHLNSV
ncbi:unnamed protein product, partial [Closterium sp. NIES-54]